jgi:RNA polymerase sigma factor (TIGR02999 family)
MNPEVSITMNALYPASRMPIAPAPRAAATWHRAGANLRPMREPRAEARSTAVAEPAAQPSAARPVAELFPALYRELRGLARSKLAGGGRHTLLDTHALVHEAYLRMQGGAGGAGVAVNDREHFLAYAASTMRSVIIDFVRRRNALRRGGEFEHVTLDTRAAAELGASDDEILAVHEALEKLAAVDERLVRVVEMRYFAGLTDAETAAALGITDRTVRRDWERARLLLSQLLGR